MTAHVENRLGEEGRAFEYLRHILPQKRLSIALNAAAQADAAIGFASEYTQDLCTETAGTIIDKCLQLHGGYGYITDYPIARLYADTRVSRIYGGVNEVMRTIIAKDLGLSGSR